jgi:hypothetical protein
MPDKEQELGRSEESEALVSALVNPGTCGQQRQQAELLKDDI